MLRIDHGAGGYWNFTPLDDISSFARCPWLGQQCHARPWQGMNLLGYGAAREMCPVSCFLQSSSWLEPETCGFKTSRTLSVSWCCLFRSRLWLKIYGTLSSDAWLTPFFSDRCRWDKFVLCISVRLATLSLRVLAVLSFPFGLKHTLAHIVQKWHPYQLWRYGCRGWLQPASILFSLG